MNKLTSPDVIKAWESWLAVTRDRCHRYYRLEGESLQDHLDVCLASGRAAATRIHHDVGASFVPRRILDIGASVGWNCIALAELYPEVEIHSVEPDPEAVDVAAKMAASLGIKYFPRVGTGESLPFADGQFDLIVCHQVVEHVKDVPQVIAEIKRVLSTRGVLHLEAPNYAWPAEPHLGVWTIPSFGKGFVRFTAQLQGVVENLDFLDHLQFVTPRKMEALFRQNGLSWENRSIRKINEVLDGETQAFHFRRLGSVLRAIGKTGLGRPIASAVAASGLYTSLLYTVRPVANDELDRGNS